MVENFDFFVLGGFGLLLIISIVLGAFCFALKKRLDNFCQGNKGNIEKIMAIQTQNLSAYKKELEMAFQKIARLDQISEKTFQKSAVIRFNPFREVGGNQSFAIALLDSMNNGFVISSLYHREASRVFAKPIKQGISEFTLSEEEKQALEKANKKNV